MVHKEESFAFISTHLVKCPFPKWSIHLCVQNENAS